MTKHTPGPWFWVRDPDGTPWGREKVKLVNKDGIEICSFGFGSNDNPKDGKEPNEYDKRLIEAAPDLLAAAEAALWALEKADCWCGPGYACLKCQVIDQVKTAITKAKGGEQQ